MVEEGWEWCASRERGAGGCREEDFRGEDIRVFVSLRHRRFDATVVQGLGSRRARRIDGIRRAGSRCEMRKTNPIDLPGRRCLSETKTRMCLASARNEPNLRNLCAKRTQFTPVPRRHEPDPIPQNELNPPPDQRSTRTPSTTRSAKTNPISPAKAAQQTQSAARIAGPNPIPTAPASLPLYPRTRRRPHPVLSPKRTQLTPTPARIGCEPVFPERGW